MLKTQIVDLRIEFYSCDFLFFDLFVLYHILVNFHPVDLIIKERDVSFDWLSRVYHSVFSYEFGWFRYCRMCHFLHQFRPHRILVFTFYVSGKFAPDNPKTRCRFAIPVSKIRISEYRCRYHELTFRRRRVCGVPVPVSSRYLDLFF